MLTIASDNTKYHMLDDIVQYYVHTKCSLLGGNYSTKHVSICPLLKVSANYCCKQADNYR